MFVDSSIFLEVELAQEHGEASKRFLKRVQKGELNAYTTNFHLDNIVIVMERYGRSWRDIAVFLTSLLQYKGLSIYPLTIYDRIKAAEIMREENLDFDDALAAYVMKKLGLKVIVSYDTDFDKVSWIKRKTPEDLEDPTKTLFQRPGC